MDNGDRNPQGDSAASSGRTAAIEAAFASMPEIDFSDEMGSAAPSPVETPASDEKPDSASTKPVVESADKAAEAKPEENARPVEEPIDASVPTSTLEPPKHWPADRRASFQNLPDDAKRIILDRNKEANVAVTKAQQEAASFRRTAESVASVFNDDHRQQMSSSGLDDIGAIRYLVQQHDALNRDPVGFLKAVIAQTGVKPEQLFGAQAPQQAAGQTQTQPEAVDEWKDPHVVALEAKIAQIEKIETDRQQQAEQHKRSEAQRFQKWFTDQCDSFENAIDDEGLPKYSHLPAVMEHVVRLVQSDPALSQLLRSNPHQALEQAYNNALYLNPEIRQSIIDAEHERRMSERDQANSVTKAQAATTRKGSPGANGVAKSKVRMSREEHINAAARELGIWS